jgi:hypothetical protein
MVAQSVTTFCAYTGPEAIAELTARPAIIHVILFMIFAPVVVSWPPFEAG